MRLRLLSLSALQARLRAQSLVLARLKKELLRRQATCTHPRRPTLPEGRDIWPMRCPDCEYRWIEYRDATTPVVDAAFALRDRTLRRKARQKRARKART